MQREGYVNRDEHRTTVLNPRQETTGADRQCAERYEEGDVVRYRQGQTAGRVLVHVETDRASEKLVNQRLAYVAVSRGQHDARIYTDDRMTLSRTLDRDVSHRSALERAPAQASRQSAYEAPPVSQIPAYFVAEIDPLVLFSCPRLSAPAGGWRRARWRRNRSCERMPRSLRLRLVCASSVHRPT